MIFQSDNVVGASPKILEAIVMANTGAAGSYGADPWSQRTTQALMRFFDCPLEVYLVTTGTAANALAAAAICPPWGTLLTHRESHVIDDECGAPEFFMGGAKIAGLPGWGGKITPDAIEAHFAAEPGGVRRPPIKGISFAQGTEFGLVHSPAEISAISALCRAKGLKLHMDGARFSNALVSLGCTPAEMTWKAGVDVLSLGGTKNGCLMAEAVVFFDLSLAEDFAFRRKRAGQTLSKQRLIGTQFEAFLDADHWRSLATHANAQAQELADGLSSIPGLRLAWPCQINEVFPVMPQALMEHLHAQGAKFYDWSDLSIAPENALGPHEVIARLVTSFLTQTSEVERFVGLAKDFMSQYSSS
ncbi:GLY1 Threonine aldolase [Rhabdaerophilaceae bacterium]